jgi:hypothetical protein
LNEGYGLNFLITNNNVGTISTAYPVSAILNNQKAGLVTDAVSLRGRLINSGDGTVTTAYGTYGAITNTGAGTIVTAYGIYSLITKSAGAITNAYGMYIYPVTHGTTLNYAIYTNAGLNLLGDQLSVLGSADRIQLILRGNATQITNSFELQKSTAAVQISFDNNGGAIFNEAGNAAGDHRIESDTYDALFVDASNDSVMVMSNVAGKVGFYGIPAIVQPTGAAQVAPAAYATGAFGLDSDAHMQALFDLVVAMRLALVNEGLIKGAA